MFKYIILFMKIRQRRMPWPTDVLLKHGVFTRPKMKNRMLEVGVVFVDKKLYSQELGLTDMITK